MTLSHSSPLIPGKGASRTIPAFGTTPQKAPFLSIDAVMAASDASRSETSNMRSPAFRPRRSVSAHTSSAPSRPLRQQTAMSKPSSARRMATARPIPRSDPVTRTLLSGIVSPILSQGIIIKRIHCRNNCPSEPFSGRKGKLRQHIRLPGGQLPDIGGTPVIFFHLTGTFGY